MGWQAGVAPAADPRRRLGESSSTDQPTNRAASSPPPCSPHLSPQVDFHTDDPIEMIKRLMVGSEGTLGFVSQARSFVAGC